VRTVPRAITFYYKGTVKAKLTLEFAMLLSGFLKVP
jgi:hypothetical protein